MSNERQTDKRSYNIMVNLRRVQKSKRGQNLCCSYRKFWQALTLLNTPQLLLVNQSYDNQTLELYILIKKFEALAPIIIFPWRVSAFAL